MSEVRRFGALDVVLFLVVLAGAGGLRVGYVKTCCHQAADEEPYQVQDDWKAEREALVGGLREGRGFVARAPLAVQEEPTAHVAIGYPWLVSLVDGSWVNLETEHLIRCIQCGLGALTAGLYFLFARRAFHSLLVGTLAGVFCAIHPFWLLNTAELNDG